MKYFSLVALVLSLSLLTGCGGSKVQRDVAVFPVKGKIVWQGNPVTSADVTFFNAEAKKSAFGRTNEKGEFQLTTFEPNDGAVSGRHTVTVSKVEAAADTAPIADIESAAYVPPTEIQSQASRKPSVKPNVLLPEKYATQATSTLIAVVSDTDKNEIELTLE